MKCPVDNVELNMSERQGVEVDYCPQCRGVWLDRGELDKIIERSGTPDRGGDDDLGGDDDEGGRGGRKKRGGFLDNLFDFGD